MDNLYIYFMENYLPFLIAIGIFVYKTYTNFQAEQEKARKRAQNQPPAPVQPRGQKPTATKKPTPASEWADWPWSANTPAPQSRPVDPYPSFPKNTPIPAQTSHTPTAYEAYSGQWEEDEVTRVRKAKEKRRAEAAQTAKRIEVEEYEPQFGFNLREAVIQSAILERPYR
jgi:hypothetical protein